MTPSALLLLALALTVAVVDWIAVGSGRRDLEYVAKPLTMVALIAMALALDPVSDAVRAVFVVALIFSLVGDVFLMVPRNLFVAGLGAFLAAHVAYIVGLWWRGQDLTWFVVGLLIVVGAVVLIGLRILRAVQTGDERAMTIPVTGYIAVISLMVASAIGTRNAFAIIGATLFYASDALIAWNRFLREHRHGRLAIMVTYHLGQIGLVLSLI